MLQIACHPDYASSLLRLPNPQKTDENHTMPELPEVETMVRGLRPEIDQRRILEMEFCPCTRRPIQITPSAAAFRRKVQNKPINSVFRFAKRVIVELEGPLFIVIEPRMTGLMLVSDPPTVDHRRICWHLAPKRGKRGSFEFWDRRALGTVRLLTPKEMLSLRESLGPDALELTPEIWASRLKKTKRPVKVAMLDQKLVAGIGNLYASEILHRAGVSPRRAADRVTRAQIGKITEATDHILNEAILYEGSTLGDGTYRNALNKDGSFQNAHVVYQKADEPCTRCDGVIRRIVQAQRSTFYCPKCQR